MAGTQHGALPLLQVTSVTGCYGIGFLIAWLAAAVNGFWQEPSRPAARPAAVCASVLAAAAVAGGARLALLPHDGRTVRIAGVSPARTVAAAERAALARIPGGRRGIAAAPPAAVDPATAAVQDDLLAATRREAAAGAKIVVWPENAVPVRAARVPSVLAAARAAARSSRIYLDIGLAVYDTAGPAFGRDETVLIGPDGATLWTYQKAHPIPGSETYKPGDGRVPVVSTPYGRIANVICYDADFPAQMRVRADIMLVPSHDWREYGRPHTDKAGLRAVEGGYALVRQDADGLSAAFDARGRVLATADYFASDRQTLVADVPVRGATTPYDRIGDLFAWLCLAAVPLLAVFAAARSRRT